MEVNVTEVSGSAQPASCMQKIKVKKRGHSENIHTEGSNHIHSLSLIIIP